MKQFISLLIFFISTIILKAQTPSLCISSDKTTSLVFPYPVVHIDRGTKDVLVQQVKEANNVVLVKAAFKNIPETNLSVVTDEGSVYSFSICYNDNLTTWIYTIPENKVTATKTYANCILDNPPAAWGMHGESWDMSANVIGIYIKSNTIYYQMRIRDFGPIDYDIDFIRFYIRDKKRSKRTASQEIELKPLYVTGNTAQVKSGDRTTIVAALEKFTLPDAKYLAIEINERNGGRHLFIKVKNKKIMRAIRLPDQN